MSIPEASKSLPATFVDWEPAPPPADLIFDDRKPLESNRHRIAMNVLIDSVLQAFQDRGSPVAPVSLSKPRIQDNTTP